MYIFLKTLCFYWRAVMEEVSNYIKTLMAEDLKEGRVKEIITRFPPEPNAYLHIGDRKSVV